MKIEQLHQKPHINLSLIVHIFVSGFNGFEIIEGIMVYFGNMNI